MVSLENEVLRGGVLADKGTDVFEFNYKPRDMDFVWLTAGGVRNPTSYLSTSPDPLATFMDYYPGGWQEIFPNGGAPSSYLGAQFGQHGEVSNLPWDYEIVEGDVSLHAMWGNHLAFGRPFLEVGCRIHLPGGATVIPHDEPTHPDGRRVRGGKRYDWPFAEGESGEEVDLSVLPEHGTLSEMLYLTDLSEGFYEIENPQKGLGLRVRWDADQMPYLWFWQEYGASGFYPWYGRHYNIGLEPFSSFPTNGLKEAVDNDTALSLGARERRRFSLRAEVFEVGPDSREGRG